MSKSIKLIISIVSGSIFGFICYIILSLKGLYFVSGECIGSSIFCQPLVLAIASFVYKFSWLIFIPLGVVGVYQLISKVIK